MNAGKLNRWVTIEAPTYSEDDQGGKSVVAWNTVTNGACYAGLEATAGSKRWESQGVLHGASHIFTIRYNAGVTRNCRIKCGDRLFGVKGYFRVGSRDEWLQVMAEEVTP